MAKQGTGLHLMVDGLTATPPTANDVRHFMFDLASKAGLHIISGPVFCQLESHEQAFAVIAESHCSVMWWPSGLVLVDLFSCKLFNTGEVIQFIAETFGFEHYRPRVLSRMGVGL